MIVETPNPAWTVYAHIAPNGKMYVGMTSSAHLTRRWNRGKGYVGNKNFFNDIQKYGWDNIQHEVVASGLTEDEAANMEKLLIAKLNLTDERFGYNVRAGGGKTLKGLKRDHDVVMRTAKARKEMHGGHYMSEDGRLARKEFLEEWASTHNPASRQIRCVETGLSFDNIKAAAKHFGFTYSTFCKSLRSGNNVFGGYTWEINSPIVRRRYHYHKDGTKNMKPVLCIETGEMYQSVKDLVPILGLHQRTINDIVQFGKERGGKHYKYITKGEYLNGTDISKSEA